MPTLDEWLMMAGGAALVVVPLAIILTLMRLAQLRALRGGSRLRGPQGHRPNTVETKSEGSPGQMTSVATDSAPGEARKSQ